MVGVLDIKLHLIQKKIYEEGVVLSILPFYRWGNWGTESVMKLQKVKRMMSLIVYLSTLNKVCGKGHCLSILLEKKSLFQLSLLKKRNEIFFLDLLNNILDVSYGLFHLSKKKNRADQFYRWVNWGTEALRKWLISERDALWWEYLCTQ